MRGSTSWGASRRVSAAAPRSWAVHEAPLPWGRPAFTLLRGLPLVGRYKGDPVACAVCGRRGRVMRVLHFKSRPWCSGERLPAESLVHTWCAVVPDQPLDLELPRTWLLRLVRDPLPPAGAQDAGER